MNESPPRLRFLMLFGVAAILSVLALTHSLNPAQETAPVPPAAPAPAVAAPAAVPPGASKFASEPPAPAPTPVISLTPSPALEESSIEPTPFIQVLPSRVSGEVVLSQGQAFMVAVADLPPATASILARWGQQTIPLYPDADRRQWRGLGGIDKELEPGVYDLALNFETTDARLFTFGTNFLVVRKKFPRTRLRVSPAMVNVPPELQAWVDEDRRVFQAVWQNPTLGRFWSGPFRRPVPGEVTAPFGQRRVYNGQMRSQHTGVDLAADIGEPVRVMAAGKVVMVRACYIEGNTVVVDHGGGVWSFYCHLSKAKVEVGRMVARGDIVALAGATGRVTGPHLHLGFQVQGVKVDALTLLQLNPWLEE